MVELYEAFSNPRQRGVFGERTNTLSTIMPVSVTTSKQGRLFFMEKLIIQGPSVLTGSVSVGGFKNAAVAVLPATIIQAGEYNLENIPDITDIDCIQAIFNKKGMEWSNVSSNTIRIDTRSLDTYDFTDDEMSSIRASIYFAGALLSRFGHAIVALPGGCNFGERPIDLHIKGFEALGATVRQEYGKLFVDAPNGLKGASIYLDTVSVGATVNIMLAAVKAEGSTTIENAAKEPHIVDLANFLNNMGAKIRGAGTDVIKITGVKELKGHTAYTIVQDMIEAGTFMIAAAATRGNVFVRNVIPKHMESLTAKLEEMGVGVEAGDDFVHIFPKDWPLDKAVIKTMPYPGFPTDLHPQMATLLTQAQGDSTIKETVWLTRFQYANELNRMGARIDVNCPVASIHGGQPLTGAPVSANDLRAGAALVIAGLCATGTTAVSGVHYIDRGYENLVDKFRQLGADIERVED